MIQFDLTILESAALIVLLQFFGNACRVLWVVEKLDQFLKVTGQIMRTRKGLLRMLMHNPLTSSGFGTRLFTGISSSSNRSPDSRAKIVTCKQNVICIINIESAFLYQHRRTQPLCYILHDMSSPNNHHFSCHPYSCAT